MLLDIATNDVDAILAKAAEKTNYEQCEDGYGYSPGDSGNFDDAHSDGVNDGEIYFARFVRKALHLEPRKVEVTEP